uniref:uracil-DNA glycosylase family protein n=1 Tax=Deinococcus sp. TaxID=47478 RepID=UPI002869A7EF
NPDGTAENILGLVTTSGLSRRDLVLWNVVPWQLSRQKVTTPSAEHHWDALPATRHLLTLLPRLEAVVLVGRHAQRAWDGVGSNLRRFEMPHPSPQNFNTRPQARKAARETLTEVRRILESKQ